MDKIKILLISDLHLGIERINPLITEEERSGTFKKIISLSQKHDMLLIAGDLIHDHNVETRYYDILNREFTSLLNSGTEIYYTPGPGELMPDGTINPAVSGLNITHLFSDDNDAHMVKSSRGDVYIYGRQCGSSDKGWDITRMNGTGFHIGLFHADFNPQISGSPDRKCIKKDDIKNMNLDFYALGKNHTFKMFRFSSKILGAYPGSAEPCSIDETGDRFAVSMEVENNTLGTIKRIAVNTGKILSDEIDCSSIINYNALIDRIKSTYPDKSIVNLTLTGDRDFLLEDNLKNGLSGYFRRLKITDSSLPSLKIMIDENTKDNSLLDVFFKELNKSIVDSNNSSIKSEILAEIISRKETDGKNGGMVLCDF